MTEREALPDEKRRALDAVRSQRATTVELLEGLEAAAWETEVVPGWRVREVAAHLITTDEGALTGRLYRLGLHQVPIEAVERWNDEQVRRYADRPVPALLHALERWGRRLVRTLAAVPAPAARRALPTPLGKVSLIWLAGMRVFDEWVHAEDIRRALGMPSDGSPARLEPVARQLFAAIPFQTLPSLPEGAAGCVVIQYTDVDVPPFGIDLANRRYGSAVAGATATVRAPAATLVMVAAGRDRWRDAGLEIEGDRAAAETVLDALRVV